MPEKCLRTSLVTDTRNFLKHLVQMTKNRNVPSRGISGRSVVASARESKCGSFLPHCSIVKSAVAGSTLVSSLRSITSKNIQPDDLQHRTTAEVLILSAIITVAAFRHFSVLRKR